MTKFKNFSFFEMGLTMGAELEAYKSGEKAVVISKDRVLFRGREMPLLEATKLAQKKDSVTSPCIFWDYKGRYLGEIYRKVYGDDC